MNRGQKNNNPLNIRRVAGSGWKGQATLQDDGRFVRFERMEWGLRAAFCILRTYARKYNLRCIRDIVTRWAPSSENNTERYIDNVCRWTGYGGRQRLTEADWPILVKAMARQECGLTLSDITLARAFALYKLYP